MANILYDRDADPAQLHGRRIAILGYGSQGHAHALNLKESGYEVTVGLRPDSPSRTIAQAAGLAVASLQEAAAAADVIMMLLPDQSQGEIYAQSVAPGLRPGDTLLFAHGFNIHYGCITPPAGVDVAMVAPKAPGHRLRELFQEGRGVPGLLAIHQDASGTTRGRALAYAQGIGCTRAGVIETTFAEETETDLFGEQTVICGGVSALIKAGFETLVEAGYQPEIAYFECLHEMKLIVDLIYEGGLAYARHSISDTAEYGDYTRGPQIIDPHVRDAMRATLGAIRDGSFAKEWLAESAEGGSRFAAMRAAEGAHPLTEISRNLRAMMSRAEPPAAAESRPTTDPTQQRALLRNALA